MSKDMHLRENEESIQFEQNLLRQVFNLTPISIQIYRPVRNVNKEIIDFECVKIKDGENMVPVENEFQGNLLLSSDSPQKALFQILTTVVNGQPVSDTNYSFQEGGKTKWVGTSYLKFGDGALVYHHDITSTKALEGITAHSTPTDNEKKILELNRQLLMKDRALEALSSELRSFNTVAANDYKETLRNVYTGLEFIARNDAPKLSETGRANVRRAQASIQKLKLLTEDIISYSTLPSLASEFKEVDLDAIFAGLQTDLKKKIELENVKIDCNKLPTIEGSHILLSLLFQHILDNAIKFRKQDSDLRILIKCEEESSPKDNVHQAELENYFVISISDNGTGFDSKHEEEVFTIFYKAHDKNQYRGSGIGLAISRKIMELHGGFITSDSEPGVGTTIRCYFPREKK